MTKGLQRSLSNIYDVGSNGSSAVAAITALELGVGAKKRTRLLFEDVAIPLVDNAGQVAYGGLKIYDFPAGAVLIDAVAVNLVITKSSAGVEDDWDGDFALGTVTASNNTTLTSTEANVIPSTATPAGDEGVSAALAVNLATIPTVLTDSSAGTPANTITALADGSTYANDVASLRNNLASLAAKVNAILAQMPGAKSVALDGTSTPVDLFLNVLVDDADHDVTTTPCNLIFNGVVEFTWQNLGDI